MFVRKTRIAQRNWIGRSEGAPVVFRVEGHNETFEIFTTRPDTLFGVTYMVFAPEHPMLDRIVPADRMKAVIDYRQRVGGMSDIVRQAESAEKTGIFVGVHAINPVNEDRVPIWVSDFLSDKRTATVVIFLGRHWQNGIQIAFFEYSLWFSRERTL